MPPLGVESITDQLARRAWSLFRELEGEGGMARAVTHGTVAERLRSAAERRRRSAATRGAPIIGASAFADHHAVSIHVERTARSRWIVVAMRQV